MTIKVAATRNEFTATTSQTVFNYTFKIFASTDLNVFQTTAGQVCNDATDQITAFTVAGVGDEDGGSITLTNPATVGDLITIVSNIPSTRTTDYQNNGDFIPKTVNDDFDRVVSLVKQAEEVANRTLVSAECQQGAKPLTLPEPSAGLFLKWKPDLTGVENSGAPGVIVNEVDSIVVSDMIASTTLIIGDFVQTIGHISKGDGGDNLYEIVAAATGTDDNGSFIDLVTFQAKGLFPGGPRHVGQWGAVTDGTTDDSAAFLAMDNFAGFTACKESGQYSVKDIVVNGRDFFGNGARLNAATGAKFIIQAKGFRPVISGPLELEDFQDNVVRNTTLSSAVSTNDTVIAVTDASNMEAGQWFAFRLDNNQYHGSFIVSISVNNVTIRKGSPSAAASGLPVIASFGMINIENTNNGLITDVFGLNCSVLCVLDGDSGLVTRLTISNMLATSIKFGGFIEGKDVAELTVTNMDLRGGHNEITNDTGTGSQTIFTTTCPIFLIRDITITVDAVSQIEGVDFTVTGRFQITFTTAPANLAVIVITNNTDGWFGHFNDQTGFTTIRGGSQYQNMIILNFFFGRFLRLKELTNFQQCLTDTCEVSDFIKESTQIDFNNYFSGFVAANIDIDEASEVQFGGNFRLSQIPVGLLVSGVLGNVFFSGSGSTLKVGSEGLDASSLSRSGNIQFLGSTPLHFGSTTGITAGATIFIGPSGEVVNEGAASFVTDRDGLLTKFVIFSQSAPGAGETYTCVVRINGADTALTDVISGASDFGGDDSDQGISVLEGQQISFRVIASAGAATSTFRGYIQLI